MSPSHLEEHPGSEGRAASDIIERSSSENGSAIGSLPTEVSRGNSPKPGLSQKLGSPALGSDIGSDDVAIIGYSLNFPAGLTTPEKFWELIVNARSALTDIPASRWNVDGFHRGGATKSGVHKTRKAHFVDQDPSLFDAPFFNITASEAICMDPQQRWLLETSYHAFENAGLSLEDVSQSRTSVFMGSFLQDYAQLMGKDVHLRARHHATGNGSAMLANRLSWFFNLKGPSLALDTACSGSLIALHLACQSIRTGETDMGIIGGCNLMLGPDTVTQLSDNGFLSQDGRSYSFDHRANGYSRGEGAGILVLKRMSDAVRDGNVIRAVIRASGTNQDGRTPGITQPDAEAQKTLIKETYQRAGLDMSLTRHFEAHGTGTPIGDPTEARSIADAFEGHFDESQPLYVSSVKANIGHLENASGVASVIKTILMLENGMIPPCANFEKLNSTIEKNKWPLVFPTSAVPWPTTGLRRASVNSFGYGGANAHVVLDDAYNYCRERGLVGKHLTQGFDSAKDQSMLSVSEEPRLLVLSAVDEDGIKRSAAALAERIESSLPTDRTKFVAEMALTIAEYRSRLPWKSFVVVPSTEALKPDLFKETTKAQRNTKPFKSLFVFTGQGAQWPRMGQELLSYQVFQDTLESCQRDLTEFGCKWSLLKELAASTDSSKINEPELSQPICTAVQIGLVNLLRSWHVDPDAVIGHSSGEVAAAYSIGAISRKSAMRIAYCRGVVSGVAKQACGGAAGMMAVGMSETNILTYIKEHFGSVESSGVYVACVNSPKNVTLSGTMDKLESLHDALQADEIFARVVKTGVPYHSPYMQGVASTYETLIQGIQADDSRVPHGLMFSSTTGRQANPNDLKDPIYWVKNMVSPVHFVEAFSHVFPSANRTKARKLGARKAVSAVLNLNFILEIGPHPALKSSISDMLRAGRHERRVVYSSTLQRNKNSTESMLHAVGSLYSQGSAVDVSTANKLRSYEHSLQMLTDLPSYPFNHSKSFWNESRASKEYRTRKHGYHELLGARDPASSPYEPRWRHYVILDEQQWIRDHNVFGLDIYPAAGLLSMAVEAARQMADDEKTVSAFCFQHVMIGQALIVPSTPTGVETQLNFKLMENTNGKTPTWYSFRLAVYSGNGWSECCSGEIGIEYENPAHEVEEQTVAQAAATRCFETHKIGEKSMQGNMVKQELYKLFDKVGLAYGPSFQALEEIRFNQNNEAMAQLNALHWEDKLEDKDVLPHIIHPSTLDNIIQLSLAALTGGGQKALPPMVPARVPKLRISAKSARSLKDPNLSVHASSRSMGLRSAVSHLSAMHLEEEVLLVDGIIELLAVENQTSSQAEAVGTCYTLSWKPDLDFLTPAEISEICDANVSPNELDVYRSDQCLTNDLDYQSYYHAQKLVDNPPNYDESRQYLHKYLDFIRRRTAERPSDFKPCENLDAYIEEVSGKLSDRAEGEMHMRIAKNLNSILDGSIDPLSVLFSDDLMTRMYEQGGHIPCYRSMVHYGDFAAHKNPHIKVLEIGAGTGSGTKLLIDILGRNGDSKTTGFRFDNYCYTDISPSFFEAAKERFAPYTSRMEFKVFDVEKDPGEQGFEPGSFDIIMAINVLHATTNIKTTVQHVNWLLKPGGHLILSELVVPNVLRTSYVYGLLPGWWRSEEEERQLGPLLTEDRWRDVLMNTGFTDFKLALPNDVAPYDMHSLMISRKEQAANIPDPQTKLLVVTSNDQAVEDALFENIKDFAHAKGISNISRLDIGEESWPDISRSFCIFLPELHTNWLHQMDERAFQRLKHLFDTTLGVLWVVGAKGTPDDAMIGVASGLSRSLRSERNDYRFITLSLNTTAGVEHMSQHLLMVLSRVLSTSDVYDEDEYHERDGRLTVCRALQSKMMDKTVHKGAIAETTLKPFRDANGRMTKLGIGTPGLLETLQFVDDESFHQPLGDNEVEIHVRATGLNFRDVLISLGTLDIGTFGYESAGIVRRIGPAVSHLKVGDRVVSFMEGAFGTVGRCPASTAVKIPDELSFEVAAALPVVACTAIHGLYDIGRLVPGESVLIHSGAGGFGQVAIQLALHKGAVVYTTVGTVEKKEFLHKEYGIPKENILSSRTLSFMPALMRLTGGRGVDIVLNSLGGEALRETWKCMAPFGRFIEVGKKDILSYTSLPMDMFLNNVSFSCLDMAVLYGGKPDSTGVFLTQAIDLWSKGVLKAPTPLQILSGSEIEHAFRLLQSGKSIGKIVISFNDDDLVPTAPTKIPLWSFDPNASYLIAGGLGGLGRNIALWMADRGARNLILLSRRTEYNDKIKETLQKLAAKGVTVATPPCDVGNSSQLAAALKSCAHLPAIKGCLQASMVLHDEHFSKMSLEVMREPLQSKIDGTINLDDQLPKDLDFFIMFASVAGVTGWQGQANYAMGNVFEDNFARYRVSKGQKAVTVDFGVIYDIGFIAENQIKDSMRTVGLLGIEEQEVLATLEYFCDPNLPVLAPDDCQMMVGMENLALYQARGGEEGPWLQRRLFSCMSQIRLSEDGTGGAGSGGFDVVAALKNVKTVEEAGQVVTEGLITKLALMLGMEKENIDTDRPLHSYGIDSLVALEIRNWFRKALGADVAVFEILSNAGITEICTAAAAKSPMLASLRSS